MRPIDRLSPEVRKLLTKSRNRIAGLILRQPAPPPPPPPQIPIAKQQNAFIDITEPLTFGSGQRRDVYPQKMVRWQDLMVKYNLGPKEKYFWE